VQGFHLCRPQPAADLNRALQRTTQQTSRTRGLRLINA
jgi:hypothetical protein